jgi:hypothetical protein
VLGQERVHRYDETWRAVTTLQPVFGLQGRLDRGQGAVASRQPLDRRHLGAVGLHGEHQARADGLTVDQYRARAADAVLAAEVCSGQR